MIRKGTPETAASKTFLIDMDLIPRGIAPWLARMICPLHLPRA